MAQRATSARVGAQVHNMYGQSESLYADITRLPWHIRDPDSMFSSRWDMLSVCRGAWTRVTLRHF